MYPSKRSVAPKLRVPTTLDCGGLTFDITTTDGIGAGKVTLYRAVNYSLLLIMAIRATRQY
jgi:hypothetical protein